mmetsp:Transcript_4189/g.10920  ORF Transcript_4189/g.10920 Transcript_4189/m.10920 type:complete len:215 (+) Transcript_4189:148-792(+)
MLLILLPSYHGIRIIERCNELLHTIIKALRSDLGLDVGEWVEVVLDVQSMNLRHQSLDLRVNICLMLRNGVIVHYQQEQYLSRRHVAVDACILHGAQKTNEHCVGTRRAWPSPLQSWRRSGQLLEPIQRTVEEELIADGAFGRSASTHAGCESKQLLLRQLLIHIVEIPHVHGLLVLPDHGEAERCHDVLFVLMSLWVRGATAVMGAAIASHFS